MAVSNKLLRACCHQLVNSLLRAENIRLVGKTFCMHVLAAWTALQDDNNNWFQASSQLETSNAHTWETVKYLRLQAIKLCYALMLHFHADTFFKLVLQKHLEQTYTSTIPLLQNDGSNLFEHELFLKSPAMFPLSHFLILNKSSMFALRTDSVRFDAFFLSPIQIPLPDLLPMHLCISRLLSSKVALRCMQLFFASSQVV
jgi:hypothetical protein